MKIQCTPEEVETRVNELHGAGAPLKDGYAPFCKHIFVPNWTATVSPTLKITPQNESLLRYLWKLIQRTKYEARTEEELPVLVRFFPKEGVKLEKAKFLDVILYSKEQIDKEDKAMGRKEDTEEYEYGIISIKPQDVDYEIPMIPITMMRNALGAEHGGSGVPLEREKYLESVAFWSSHATVK
eukprot:TRINITY_DN10431_c0_g3_i3.p1 TRINITY_DN10431_c0_g3~~TRINITY_DN10431_c0_g3_i3.p1  ORF type:complete len:183 (-),score=44.02 TRINITY_DN10431_c0_g3_i3:91-639(-)